VKRVEKPRGERSVPETRPSLGIRHAGWRSTTQSTVVPGENGDNALDEAARSRSTRKDDFDD